MNLASFVRRTPFVEDLMAASSVLCIDCCGSLIARPDENAYQTVVMVVCEPKTRVWRYSKLTSKPIKGGKIKSVLNKVERGSPGRAPID